MKIRIAILFGCHHWKYANTSCSAGEKLARQGFSLRIGHFCSGFSKNRFVLSNFCNLSAESSSVLSCSSRDSELLDFSSLTPSLNHKFYGPDNFQIRIKSKFQFSNLWRFLSFSSLNFFAFSYTEKRRKTCFPAEMCKSKTGCISIN